MGQKQSAPATFFCPKTSQPLPSSTLPVGTPCAHCGQAHDIILQSVYVCPNTGYRINDSPSSPTRKLSPDRECPSCFQLHEPFSKRVYICPVTGAQIPHPSETGGRCQKCSRSHADNSVPTPMGSRETVSSRSAASAGGMR